MDEDTIKAFENNNYGMESEGEEYLQKDANNKAMITLTIIFNTMFIILFPFVYFIKIIYLPTILVHFLDGYSYIIFKCATDFYFNVVLFSIISSLIVSFIFKRYKEAVILSLLPLINIISIVIFIGGHSIFEFLSFFHN